MSFYKFVTKAFKCFVNIFYKYKVIGAENIPDEGNVIIAANHKSNLDPIFLAAAIENRQVAAIAKKELFDIKPLAYILKKLNVIPINRSIISNYKLFNRVTIFIDKPISFEEYYKQKLTSEENERLSQNVLEVIKENYYIHSK